MRILFVGANAQNLPDLRIRQELRDIREEVRRAPGGARIDIQENLAARPKDLLRQLADFAPDVVHFSGHGVRGRRSKDPLPHGVREFELAETPFGKRLAGEIILEDDVGQPHPVSAAALRKLFDGKVVPRCVVLNACHTANTARELAEHVDFVAGMKHAVPDEAAIQFAVGFYQALARGWNIEHAFHHGKSLIHLEDAGGDTEDEFPVLHRCWQVRLENFLANFTEDDLRGFIRWHLKLPQVTEAVRHEKDHQRRAAIVAEAIANAGLASEDWFQGLVMDPYDASKRLEVEEIVGSWRRATATTPLVSPIPASRGSKPTTKPPRAHLPRKPTPSPFKIHENTSPKPPPSAPRDSSLGLHTHTSIVLDRIEQWQTLVYHCKSKRCEHRLFILHGPAEQNVDLFMRRIKSFLAATAKQEHAVLKVERVDELTTARMGEEWKRSVRRAAPVQHGSLHHALIQLTANLPILMLFMHSNNRALTGLDESSIAGLADCIQQIDKDLHYEPTRFKHSIRIVIAIEGATASETTVPMLEQRLRTLRQLHVTTLPPLTFPPWDPDILRFIRETYPKADDGILNMCKSIHAEIARTDRSLKSLADRIDFALHHWIEQNHGN